MHTHTGLFSVKSSDFSSQKQQKEKSTVLHGKHIPRRKPEKQSPRVPLPPGPEEAFGDGDIWPFACLGILYVSHRLQHHLPGTCWVISPTSRAIYWRHAQHIQCARTPRRCVTFANIIVIFTPPACTPPGHHNNHSHSSTSPGSQPTETLILTFQINPCLYFFRIICKHCCLLLKHPRYFSLNIFAPRFVTRVRNLGLF